MRHLIDAGADVDVADGEPLRVSIANNDVDAVRLLLVKGHADVHVKDETPLRVAFAKQFKDILRLLIEKGAADMSIFDEESLEKIEDRHLKTYLLKKYWERRAPAKEKQIDD